ncbi:YafY family transcriptional regulator [Paraburkholderia sp. D15]|uniref:helix-turn-helix transcriptional regulator n=1 Tax=Paraburkholderia sp. D15 TaxID=2880218 RepID=UPI00247A0955|nr:YafY family protein [Paraburkholderia sp. D15]WGS49694.1 YafY family transcriptional regulator [Paraburkholderia sp. D15]
MRASRLLSILMTLQARGRVTAQALADECSVSLRTIYRDIDALSAAGVPVHSERGAEGGYRLLDGYRTRLNGLSSQEAEALFLSGLPGPVQALGLGAVMAGAQTKLLAALPVELRSTAERMRSRFHLDAPAWFSDADQPAHLPLIARAVWEQHPLQIRYQSWKAEKSRRIEPLGVVLKSGAWYVVGRVDADVRIYRIARILELSLLDDTFERLTSFDLATYWDASTRRLSEEMYANEATLRLSPWGVRMLEAFTSPFACASAKFGEPDPVDGWCVVTLPVGSTGQACAEFLRFGSEAEVLAPPELRVKIAEVVANLHRRYSA